MSYLIINGGKKLHGTVVTQSTKNSAMSILFATLMIRGVTTLTDVPEIDDVRKVIALIKSIGAVVTEHGNGKVTVDASGALSMSKLDKKMSESLRSSLFFFGALAAREKAYTVYRSGGCHLGERTVRPHLYALEKVGVSIATKQGRYEVKNSPLKAAHIVMYESGDTTTENAVMAAVLAPGITTIKLASANYMVQDLCYFLVAAGAKISGIGTTTLTIEGVKQLRGVNGYAIMPDPIVSMTFLSAAIATHSTLTVANCPLEFLELELCKLEVMGQKYEITNRRRSKNGKFEIVDITVSPSSLKALPDKIYGRPFPGLNIDNLPLFVPILTQAKGRTLVHDWVYENRAVYNMDLQKLGANVTLVDVHRLYVEGPSKLTPGELLCPPALRPAVNVLICMLAAKGKSILRGTKVIDRGYEHLYDLFNSLGADIRVMQE